MRNIPNKVDDSGDTLPAGGFNAWKNEAQGIVTSAGLSLDPAGGPDTDTEMVKKALAIITAMGCYYDDTGSADAYVLAHPNSTEHVPAYEDGMVILFKAANTNTGASTGNINSLGAKNITLEDGTVLSGGEIITGKHVLCQYNLTDDRIEVIHFNADTVDGIHASTTAAANQLLALNGSSKLPADITGDADTVDTIHASASAEANKLLALDSNAQLPTVSPSFSVHKNGTNQSISSATWIEVTWSTEEFDTNNDFASNAFTPSVPGKFLLCATAYFLSIPDQEQVEISVYKNGSSYKRGATPFVSYGSAIAIATNIAVVVDANGSTDTFKIYVRHFAGAGIDLSGDAKFTHFTGCKIS